MKPAFLIFCLLCTCAIGEDDDYSVKPADRNRIRASLLAMSKAESIKVYGQLDHTAADGSLKSVPITKEILSHSAIAELSGLLTSTRWELVAKSEYYVEATAPFVHLITYEKGKKADEFRIIGGAGLVHPWLGLFRAEERSISDKALNLILKAK